VKSKVVIAAPDRKFHLALADSVAIKLIDPELKPINLSQHPDRGGPVEGRFTMQRF
jgi:hypothetical protein